MTRSVEEVAHEGDLSLFVGFKLEAHASSALP